MIKDVKSYFQTVASRLSHAFSVEGFDTEKELEFWSLAAEHVSRSEIPGFNDIVSWVDLLFKAPVHCIYVRENEGSLRLFRRQIIHENIQLRNAEKEDQRKARKFIREFEEQLENLERKIAFREEFESQGDSNFAIGPCQHIPLYDGDRFWGIYCAGPYVRCPETMMPKLSIVSRILSGWMTQIYEQERRSRHAFEHKATTELGELSSGSLNVEGIAGLLVGFLVNATGAEYGVLLESSGAKVHVLAEKKLPAGFKDQVASMDSSILKADGAGAALALSDEKLQLHEQQWKDGDEGVVLLLAYESAQSAEEQQQLVNLVEQTIGSTLDYRRKNRDYSTELVDTYYGMLRNLEQRKEKTRSHTPRMMAFADQFADLFGMEPAEKEQLVLTARLHDIGYVGVAHFITGKTVGAELEHPVIGEQLVRYLALPEDVKLGIRTHHEWIDGSGTPNGLREEDIPWTGKIIGMFEFIVDFVETNLNDDSKTDEEWLRQLSEELVERADKQFDMVLIPTAIELVSTLGWRGCCGLGGEA